MTLEGIDHLVFGYEEGHRLLGGSRRIPGDALAVLLGATDAPIESSKDRLVTGFPLDAIARYALCFTWNAPELPRPGAVWSHVLLVESRHFERPGIISVLKRLGRRPELLGLGYYSTQIDLGNEEARGGAQPFSVSSALVESIATAVYGDGKPIVVHGNVAESEAALFAVWEAQWPELRARFEFRTRESTRAFSSSGVVVARRVQGMVRHGTVAQRTACTALLVEAIARKQGSPLHRFLREFGPADRPETDTVGWLARLYCYVEAEDYAAVRDALEARYCGQHDGRRLKEELFGQPEGSWWTVTEAVRLGTILGAACDAWDLETLALERRLNDWIRVNGAGTLLQGVAKVGLESVRGVLLNALVQSGRASDVAPLARIDPELAARWLVERPFVGREPHAWHELEDDEVGAVWAAVGSPDVSAVLAAAVAGHAHGAIHTLGLGGALRGAARDRDLAAVAALVEASAWSNVARVAEEDAEVAVMLGAVSFDRDVPGVVDALEARRDKIDEPWLKAAAGAIARLDMPVGRVLEVVFGPLHHAITDNRLPLECWEVLNCVLPEAPDPALRLRRFLVGTAKEEGWGQKRYRRALRGAGPYASELYRELNDDTLLLGRVRGFIERL